ncbi:kinase-like protein [Hypoxylon trugodes]|uniref:kinase-like protein n=1 Tax=Hypoxylon trugodes TaxID=326681 RepID=UPI0021954D82|nr:kinase-like protein [Hypoxylon trugodes]KAI1387929.1 kinase-like protein [Hypoxylon trugodes]
MDRTIALGDSGDVALMSDLRPDKVSRANFHKCLESSKHYVRDFYQSLELLRFENIPARLMSRKPKFLMRDELIELDRWVQKRGRHLQIRIHKHNENLIKGNSDEDVEQVTSRAYRQYSNNDPFPAMNTLTSLKGVGLSRACLLLSVAYPETVPFISDELFKWIFPDRNSEKKRKRDRKDCLHMVNSIISRLTVTAVDIEKVAFVLHCEDMVAGLRRPGISKPPGRPIGEGAFGRVYKTRNAMEPGDERDIAIKHTFKIPSLKRHRLFAEILDSSLLAKKSPEYFVQFIGWNEDDSSFLLAMEYIEFGNLKANLKNIGDSWTQRDTQSVTRQTLEALKVMHSANLTHRDLKPEVNILVVLNQLGQIRIKIADFGISKRRSDRGTTFLRTAAGTFEYRAPEIAKSWKAEQSSTSSFSYTEKVDLWSLGCVIFEMDQKKKLFPDGAPNTWDDGYDQKLTGELDSTGLGQDGIQLVKQLLHFKARNRPSAEAALGSKWLAIGE